MKKTIPFPQKKKIPEKQVIKKQDQKMDNLDASFEIEKKLTDHFAKLESRDICGFIDKKVLSRFTPERQRPLLTKCQSNQQTQLIKTVNVNIMPKVCMVTSQIINRPFLTDPTPSNTINKNYHHTKTEPTTVPKNAGRRKLARTDEFSQKDSMKRIYRKIRTNDMAPHDNFDQNENTVSKML